MSNQIDVEDLIKQIDEILEYLYKNEEQFKATIGQVHPKYRESARNLVHYIAFRHFDIRKLQDKLAALGLSSLGRAEGHVLPTLLAVKKVLVGMNDRQYSDLNQEIIAFKKGKKSLKANTKALFGRFRKKRVIPIMVTLPTEAAHDPQLIEDLILSGMDVARINCAHDGAPVWTKMIGQVNRVNKMHQKSCKISMDLAGPKVRTGPLASKPMVLHIKPKRNYVGEIVQPGRVKLVPEGQTPLDEMSLPVNSNWLNQIKEKEWIHLKDTRGKKRKLLVEAVTAGHIILESDKSAYITTGTNLQLIDNNGHEKGAAKVGVLPMIEDPLVLRIGDRLLLTSSLDPGSHARTETEGKTLEPARIGCTLPEVFRDIKPGVPILLDDGKIAGEVISSSEESLEVLIIRTKPNGSKLRGDKGINFPGSYLSIHGFTEKDKKDLQFVAQQADVVGLSFVKGPGDVMDLQEALGSYVKEPIGIILKVETQQGFDQLPMILLAAMKSYPVGVMIARGDLAIECGWERLAEIQEEILWLCEAAHIPVIWATQVLEGKTKVGLPSRAEITDAAMAQRADCVMLGKGSHINEAITMLDNIIYRMQGHQDKKTPMLRKLGVSEGVHA
ncbi:MAG: pyruvate kinase [Cyclobacteriaceae bacterium]